jgi:hypothetical protein
MHNQIVKMVEFQLSRPVVDLTVATDDVYETRTGSKYSVKSAGDTQVVHRLGGESSDLSPGTASVFTGVAMLATLEDGLDRLVVVDLHTASVVLSTTSLPQR